MKPISVTFQGFGPYLERQTVDFRSVARNGLFLIRGETGAGKTTILDAICCALYGQSSNGDKAGQPGRGGLEAMRCRSAPPDAETLVEFVFEQDGLVYTFRCRLWPNRRGNLNEEEKCSVRGPDGTETVLAAKKTEVWRKAAEIIGLEAEQFRQVIVLPQGKFQQLLISEDKAPILSSLFGAGRLRTAAGLFRDRVLAESTRLKAERELIADRLRFWECDAVAALAEKHAAAQAECRALQETLTAHKAALLEAQDALSAAAKAGERFTALDGLRAELQRLLDGAQAHQTRTAALEAATRAATAQPAREALTQALRRTETAVQAQAKADRDLQAAEAAGAKAAADSALHAQGQAEQENRKCQAALLESKRDAYAAAERLQRDWAEQEARWPGALRWEQKARAELEAGRTSLARKREALAAADAEHSRLAERYLAEIAGELGMQLREGMKCPVCGSVHHPEPARVSDDHVTRAQVDAQKKVREQAEQAVREQEAANEKAQQAYENGKAGMDRLRADIDRLKAALDAARSQLPAEIPDAAALERTLDGLRTAVTAWDRETERLRQAADRAAAAAAAARGIRDREEREEAAAREAMDAAQTAWDAQRIAAGFPDDDAWTAAWLPPERLQQLQSETSSYETRLQDCRDRERAAAEAVRDLPRPDMAALQARRDEADAAHGEVLARLSSLSQQAESMEKALAELRARDEQLGRDTLVNTADKAVADALVGLRGRVSLEDYMLSAMLTSVTLEANRLLADMYNGRFRLAVPAGGSLQLEVEDRDFDVRGSVASLSGGEKFLVALALGIGLANVVSTQHHAVNMDALFIDEGFGSLDPKACQEAVSVLNSLRGSRMVGVISHVEALREDISSQLVAVKTPRGSKLEVH